MAEGFDLLAPEWAPTAPAKRPAERRAAPPAADALERWCSEVWARERLALLGLEAGRDLGKGRNERLFLAVLAMAETIAHGYRERSELDLRSEVACYVSELGISGWAATVDSAIRRGLEAPRPIPDGALLAWPEERRQDDNGNARTLVDRNVEGLRYCTGLGWLVWDGLRWVRCGGSKRDGQVIELARALAVDQWREAEAIEDESARKAARSWAKHTGSVQGLRGMVGLAESDPRVAVGVDELDRDPMLLVCKNGVLDLRAGELRGGQRGDLCTMQGGASWAGLDAAAPRWSRFLEEVTLGRPGLARWLQKAVGYSLTGLTVEHVLFFCWGSGGNGKGTFLRAVQWVLGDYAHAAQIETFVDGGRVRDGGAPSPDIAAMRGARLVTAQEPRKGSTWNEARLKELTGGDPVSARELHQAPLSFVPQLKLWLSSNPKPAIHGTDAGIWRRMRLIPWELNVPVERADHGLDDALRAEASGVLAWAVAGCLAWQREGLGACVEVTNATATYRLEEDQIGRWLEDRVVLDPAASTPISDLRRSYEAWCSINGEAATTGKALGAELEGRGFRAVKATKGARVRVGLRLDSNS